MNKERFKGFIMGMALVSVISFTSNSSLASTIQKNIQAVYSDIKIVVDGVKITPKDSSGKIVEPFIYEGTTYLPVRAISEALGKAVYWDQITKTVYIGEMPKITNYFNAPSSPSFSGEKLQIEDLLINIGSGNYIEISGNFKELVKYLGQGEIRETGYFSPNNENYRHYEYSKDGIRVYYYDDPNEFNDYVHIELAVIETPKYPTYRGLKVGDSYDKMVQLYGKVPVYVQEGDKVIYMFDEFESIDEDYFANLFITIDIKTNKVINYYTATTL